MLSLVSVWDARSLSKFSSRKLANKVAIERGVHVQAHPGTLNAAALQVFKERPLDTTNPDNTGCSSCFEEKPVVVARMGINA